MARAAKTNLKTDPIDKGARRGRPPSQVRSTARSASTAKSFAPAASAKRNAALPTPKVSKDELRAQVEKLERNSATLRAKNRELGRAAKAAYMRIEELEVQIARLEKKAAAVKPAMNALQSTRAQPARGRGRRPGATSSDSAPTHDAEENAAPLDEQARAVRSQVDELEDG